MSVSRRQFIRDGVATFAVSFAAPAFLSDIARAQGARARSLVVLYLGGGNDSLNTVIPYTDAFYQGRRPNIFIPSVQVLQIGTDSSGRALGFHPRLAGLRTIFNEGRLAIIQRTGYPNSSRSHFVGTDIWNTADPTSPSSMGWLGRYLETVPLDPLSGWSTVREVPRALLSKTVPVPGIPDPRTYAFASPNGEPERTYERAAATRIASHVPIDRPNLAFINSRTTAAFETLDKVNSVADYVGTAAYPANNPLATALRTVAGSISRSLGTRVFWVQTGGFDTHANQGLGGGGTYANLMGTYNDAVFAFYTDLRNQGLLGDTLVLQFSEFGRRISENGTQGTDHGAAAVMMAIGGAVRGGIFGTAPDLNPFPGNPTLENNGGDITFETDFRSVYARVLDNWLGASSTAILGGDFRNGPAIV